MKNPYENIIGIQKCEYCGQLKTVRKVTYEFPSAGPNASVDVVTCLTCTPKKPCYVLLKYSMKDAKKVFIRHKNKGCIDSFFNILKVKNEQPEELSKYLDRIKFVNSGNDDTLSLYVPTEWIDYEKIEDTINMEISLIYVKPYAKRG